MSDDKIGVNRSRQRDFGGGSSASVGSLILIIVSLFVGLALVMTASNPSNASGIIDGATMTGLFAGAMLLFVWLPVFLASIVLAVKAIRQGDPWGYACLFAHVVIIGGFFAFSMISKTLDTPERRAARQQKWLEHMANRQAPRPLGGIDISRDSTLFKVTNSSWLIPGSFALLALALAFRAIRSRSFNDPATAASISPLDARCPVCQANIGRVLISGGKVCPSCNAVFLHQSEAEPERKMIQGIGVMFHEGSSLKRISAAVLAGGFLLSSAAWVWYWALGDSASSNRMLIIASLLAGALAVMIAAHASVDRTA